MLDIIPEGHSWEGWPRLRALAWCRAFFDFPPAFPGAEWMTAGYRSYLREEPPGFAGWPEFALHAEAVGMSPDHYYTLRLTLSDEVVRRHVGHPLLSARADADGSPQSPIDPMDWGRWVVLVDGGLRPSHATQAVLGDLDAAAFPRLEPRARTQE